MNKATTTVASVPLTWGEDDALASMARVLKMPKAGVLRLGLLAILKEYAPAEAAKMLRSRIHRQTVCCVGALLLIGLVEYQAWTSGDESEFRRTGRAKVCRVARVKGREIEFQTI